MKKRVTYHGAKGRFASKAKARYLKVGNKTYQLPKGKKDRQKIIDRAQKRALKPSFSDKIKKQGLRRATSQPTQARYFSETKTLTRPGMRGQTFDIVKWTYQLNRPIKITPRTILKQVKRLRRNSYPKLIGTFSQNKGKNFLFRIDTAYIDESKEFSKTTGVYKKDKDGLSDGRGFSIGRYLKVDKKKKFVKMLDDTFREFLKAFETYSARNGIAYGQINALILEVS